MKILYIAFHVKGVMKDNFIQVGKSISVDNELFVLTNNGISSSDIPCVSILNILFDRNQYLSFINLDSYLKIYQYIHRTHYDIAFIANPHPVNIIVSLMLKKSKTVSYIHDYIPHLGTSYIDKMITSLQLSLLYQRSRKIIVSSNWMKEKILQNGLFSRPNDISVIYLGLLNNLIKDTEDITSENIDILFFGRIEYYKGLDILFESIKYIQYNPKIIIVGKGDIEKTFNKPVPSQVIHVNGYIADTELARYIADSKVVVLPYREASGTQTIQTVFYYKKPIVASNVGCFPEYITDGVDGVIVEKENPKQLGETITLLLKNEHIRHNYGEKGYAKTQTVFSESLIKEQYISLFQSIQK